MLEYLSASLSALWMLCAFCAVIVVPWLTAKAVLAVLHIENDL